MPARLEPREPRPSVPSVQGSSRSMPGGVAAGDHELLEEWRALVDPVLEVSPGLGLADAAMAVQAPLIPAMAGPARTVGGAWRAVSEPDQVGVVREPPGC
jgi:hypothetical protein